MQVIGYYFQTGEIMKLSLKTSESFNEVMKLYLPTVYRIAFTRLKNAADAEDAAQDVFLWYFKADKTFESEEHRKAFLIRCAINRANSYASSAHARHTAKGELLENMTEISCDNASETVLKTETQREVLDAVMKLAPKYRTVIHLFYFEDMTIAQIAEVTDSKESAVKSRLMRAREKLKSTLGGYEFD